MTRDRKEMEVEWNGDLIALIDTGGIDAGDDGPFQSEIAAPGRARDRRGRPRPAGRRCDHLAGAADLELAERLRRSRVPVLLVANKVDNPARHDEALEYHELGLGDPFAISALHGIATGDLLDEIVERLARRWTSRASSASPTRSASSSSAARTSASRAS